MRGNEGLDSEGRRDHDQLYLSTYRNVMGSRGERLGEC